MMWSSRLCLVALPEIAVLGPLNHVTYVTSLDLYLDSTQRLAPFGVLPWSDLDKPTVLTRLDRLGPNGNLNVEHPTMG